MRTLDLKQGEANWLAHRATARNASDAAAVLGCSPHKPRNELLHEKWLGMAKDHGIYVEERIFAPGHAIEAAKRPVAEAIIGEDLFPVVGSEVVDGIELSASFDGLTMMEDTNWECKTLNDALHAALPRPSPESNAAFDLPKFYRVQMQQQCMVSGCTRVLFTASDGQDDDRHVWYYSDDALAKEIIAGWKQFDLDLAAYVPPTAGPVLVAAAQETLPAVSIKVEGSLKVVDNLALLGTRLKDRIAKTNVKPVTDQDFVNIKDTSTTMEKVVGALDGEKRSLFASMESVNERLTLMDTLRDLANKHKILCINTYKTENDRRKLEIIQGGKDAFTAHIGALNARLGKPYMPAIAADFAGVAKNLRTLASLQNAVDTELARVKIESSAVADRLQANLTLLRETAADHAFLFADTAQIVLKATDDFKVLVESRIAAHKAAEADRLEKERERIRTEELARIERENAARAAQVEREAQAKAAAEIEASKPPQAQEIPAQAAPETVAPTIGNVVALAARPAPAPATPPSLKLGDINARIGPMMQTSAAGLAALDFYPAQRQGTSVLFHEHQYPLMLAAMVAHLEKLQAKQAA